MHDQKTTQLRSKRLEGTKQAPVRLGPDHNRIMKGLQHFYQDRLGRPVSQSLVVRRALEVLGGQVAQKLKAEDQGGMDAEVMALIRHIR